MISQREAPSKRHERATFGLMLYPLLLPVLYAGTLILIAVFNGPTISIDRWAGFILWMSLWYLLGMIYQWPLYPLWAILLYVGFRWRGRALHSNSTARPIRDLVVSNIAFTLLFVLPPVLYHLQIIPYVGP